MEDKLTKEEVMHVAKLARIEIDDDELAMYQVKLKQILNEIEKINECSLRADEEGEMLNPKEVLKNAPRHNGNYISVPVVIGEKGGMNV